MASAQNHEMSELVRVSLKEHPKIDENNIVVFAESGGITLRGRVADSTQRQAAEQIAVSTSRTEVRNLIEVNRAGANADQDLSQHIQRALQETEGLCEADIRVFVNDGLALLSGSVPAPSQRYQAEKVVRRKGVTAVRNEIQVAGM